jgi:hypothetical protein
MRQARQNPARQARSTLFWFLSYFALSELALEVASGRRLPEMRDPEYGVRVERLRQRMGTTRQRPFTVLMLGSSRTTLGFVGSRLESCLADGLHRPVLVYNFGLTGAGPILEELVLHRLLSNGIKPDLLLVEVIPPLLAGQWPHELNRLPITRLWLEELPPLGRYGAMVANLRADWWRSRPVPAYAYRFSILSRLLPAFVPYQLRMDWLYRMDDSGDVVGLKKRSPEWHDSAVRRTLADYERYFINFQIEGPEANALRNLLTYCRKMQIPAALILMPEAKAFRNLYPANAWRKIETFTVELGREFGVPLINAREWMRDSDFSDAHHLLEEGAVCFTDRLGRQALLPLLRNRTPLDDELKYSCRRVAENAARNCP